MTMPIPEFAVGERVRLSRTHEAGRIVARVRADDDPRKCVPFAGKPFVLRGTVRERDAVTYLVDVPEKTSLLWTRGQSVLPVIPGAARAHADEMYRDVRALSCGTLSYLTGFRRYEDLDRIHTLFTQHVLGACGSGTVFSSWIDAWSWLLNGEVCEQLPAYDEVDRLFCLVHKDDLRKPQASDFRGQGEHVPAEPGFLRWYSFANLGPDAHRDNRLIRLGVVAKHWLGPKDAERLRRLGAEFLRRE